VTHRATAVVPRPILAGILAVAALDIVEPIVFYGLTRGTPPIRILQSVASGLLGRASYDGGGRSALLGAMLHLFIAAVVVIVYWLASRRLPALTRRPLLCGILYGLAVYAVMNFVVIPLSAIGGGARVPPLPALLNGLFAHVVCVGPPAAFAARAARSTATHPAATSTG
jgi:uncharacterized membrane protein YagU involved in acid resistance